MSGGNFSVSGGFWSLISVVPNPWRTAVDNHTLGSSVTISWRTRQLHLQQNANLALANGWAISGYTISTANGTNSITITSPTGNLFFRLSILELRE